MGQVRQVGQVGGLFGDPKGKVYLRYRVGGMGGVCHVLKMVYSYFVSLIYVFYFLS